MLGPRFPAMTASARAITPVKSGDTNATVKICAAWIANGLSFMLSWAVSGLRCLRGYKSSVFDSFQRHRSLSDHRVDARNESSDLLFRVDDFDEDREVT